MVLVSCLFVGDILTAHGDGNCWTLFPLSFGSLGKKRPEGREEAPKGA